MSENSDTILRDQLVQRLRGRGAHMPFEDAVRDFPIEQINTKFPNGTYSAWALVEHLRLTQWDILDYVTNPQYQHREWPKEYWPDESATATAEDWERSVRDFLHDLQALIDIVRDPQTDLFAPIPWAPEHNILREVLIVTDHNAYHVGEFAIMRQVTSTW